MKTKLDIEANERDGNKCVMCSKEKNIETHHIVPGVENLSNLITLCHSCHKKEHNYSGCFKKGYDSRRGIIPKERCGINTRFRKGVYFNRYENRWIGI